MTSEELTKGLLINYPKSNFVSDAVRVIREQEALLANYEANAEADRAEWKYFKQDLVRVLKQRDAAEHVLRCYEMDGPIAFKSALKAHRAGIQIKGDSYDL